MAALFGLFSLHEVSKAMRFSGEASRQGVHTHGLIHFQVFFRNPAALSCAGEATSLPWLPVAGQSLWPAPSSSGACRPVGSMRV